MAENWGDLLARNVSKRVGLFFAAEANLVDIDLRDRDDARLFVALAEASLWVWNPTSNASAGPTVVIPTDAPATGRLIKIGSASAAFSTPPIFPEYTVGTVPAAATYDNGVIIVSDEVGGRTLATSDGTNWRRVSDGAIVS